jgi:hypothetical protein
MNPFLEKQSEQDLAAIERQNIIRGVYEQPSVGRELSLIDDAARASKIAAEANLALRQALNFIELGMPSRAREAILIHFGRR